VGEDLSSRVLTNSAIDRLGESLRENHFSEGSLRQLDSFRQLFRPAYRAVADTLARKLRLDVTGRPSKSTNSICDKLRRERCRLSQVQDIAGFRVVVDDVYRQDLVTDAVTIFMPGSTVFDRRAKPNNGYRAVHVVTFIDRRPVEVQIRSVLQHLWAEVSEKLSDTVDPAIKYGGGSAQIRELLSVLSNGIKDFEDGEFARADVRKLMERTSGPRSLRLKSKLRDAEKSYWAHRKQIISLLTDIRSNAAEFV